MTQQEPGQPGALQPECLAAYVDGELDAATQRQVDCWLEADPRAAAEVAGQRRVMELLRNTSPPQPEPSQWHAVRCRVEQAMHARRAWPKNLGRLGLAVAGLAASTLLAVTLLRQPREQTVPQPPAAFEPFVVADPEDIEIQRMRAADRSGLVVGRPPLEGTVEWAAPGDVHVLRVSANADGLRPTVATDDSPYIMAPLNPTENSSHDN
jgi:hypothetical protein